jgi:hypothetical protein
MPEAPPEKSRPNGQPAGDRITPVLDGDRTPSEPPPAVEPPPAPETAPPLAQKIDAMELAAGAMAPPGAAPAGPPAGPGNNLPAANATPPPEFTDTHGTKFDPSIHRMKPDGSPAKNKHGNFYRKDTGRPRNPPPKAAAKPARPAAPAAPIPAAAFNAPPPGFAAPGAPPPPAGPDRFDALAETILRIWYGPAVLIFSEEIRTTQEEHAVLKAALGEGLRSSDVEDLPPWVAFSLIAGGIYLPKFSKPTVKQRLGILVLRVRGFLSGLFGRNKRPAERPAIEAAPARPRSASTGGELAEEDPFRENG